MDNEMIVLEPPDEPNPFVFQRSPAFDALNMTVEFRQDAVYKLTHFWTTFNGSWEQNHVVYAPPRWAWDLFLRPEFDDAGGDHHIFGAVLGRDGKLKPEMKIHYFTKTLSLVESVKPKSGWGNTPIWSSFNPVIGERGWWNWKPQGPADVLVGASLPLNHHVSFFGVWTERDMG